MKSLKLYFCLIYIFIIFINNILLVYAAYGDPYQRITKLQTDCEFHAMKTGTLIGDAFNSFDEDTEWDVRLHHDYITEHLGFAGWMESGTWASNGKTADKNDAKQLMKRNGWSGIGNDVNNSSYWAFNNQWIYMMGDSTLRQVWATFVSSFQGNDFERNAKEWTRENCERQYPHRKKHPPGEYFPEEGWGGKCGNNEVTCHLSGFGSEGKFTFDWKHFPYEDYDEWIFGKDGLWKDATIEHRRPDVLVIQLGLHTCHHAFDNNGGSPNVTMIRRHESDLHLLMQAIGNATAREPYINQLGHKTMVIFMLAGRTGITDHRIDKCSWRFNRVFASIAHLYGYPVLEREELERRFLYKTEYAQVKWTKYAMHLDSPAPQMIGTSLLSLVSCLRRNGSQSLRFNDIF